MNPPQVLDRQHLDHPIELAAQTQPELILLDLAMPVRDGLQALPELRRVAPEAQIVVCQTPSAFKHAARVGR